MKALLFDCDGVLVDTERDGHRVAFNRAFADAGLQHQWSVEEYGRLLQIAGGKERMRHYFDTVGWPPNGVDRDQLIRRLHQAKTELFMKIIDGGELPLRPGVARLVDEALGAGVAVAVCSTSNEKAVNRVVEVMLGPGRRARFAGIFAGDIVPHKKPAPDIYELAKKRLGVAAAECVVIEDSRNGLLAAKAAGMRCVITTSAYTLDEDFTGADWVVPALDDPPDPTVTLARLQQLP